MQIKDSTVALAQQMADYESKKGLIAKTFGFEARDGALSKIVKVAAPVITALSMISMGFAAAKPLGPFAAGATAVLTAIAGGIVSSKVNTKVLSDVHDSKKSFLGKAAHYLAADIPSIIVSVVMQWLAPAPLKAAAVITSYLVAKPILNNITSGFLSDELGDKAMKTEHDIAKQLAKKSIETGQSVEAIVAQEKSQAQSVSSYKNSVTPQEYALAQQKMANRPDPASLSQSSPEAGLSR